MDAQLNQCSLLLINVWSVYSTLGIGKPKGLKLKGMFE